MNEISSFPHPPASAGSTPAPRVLAWCLHALFAALLALTAAHALDGVVADGGARPVATVAVAVVCALVYAAGPTLPGVRRSRRSAGWWLGAVCVCWLALLALSADAVWLAFALFFLQLHLLPRRAGLAAVAASVGVAVAGFAAHEGSFTAAMALGPVLGGAVAVAVVWGYRALYRESEQRRRLIEQLGATRADLAAAQHRAGVLAERERLAREIHDTIAQGLSSIQLLLRAAERALPQRTDAASGHVRAARQAASDNLAEARRFVAGLTPPSLDGATLEGALERLCATTRARHRLAVRLEVTGQPRALPTAHEVALLRMAQSALANTVRHSGAATARVTLGYRGDEVTLDVLDDGCGFDPQAPASPDPEHGGYGLAAMRARIHALDGTLTLASRPGRGTSVTARLPLPAACTRDASPGPDAQPSTASSATASSPTASSNPAPGVDDA